MIRLLRRVLAATLLGVAAGPVALAAPAHAAACPGVTVVVNSSVGCDADGGGRAAGNFADAGHHLRYASRAPGFVCQVDGFPKDEPCVEAAPSDAYWALFWSNGTSGEWVYSSLGASALRVPQGGAVAFVFQSSTSRTWPSVAAPVASAPQPSKATTRPGGSAPGSSTRAPKADQRKPVVRRTAGGAAPVPGSSVPTTAPTATVPTPSASVSTAPSTAPTATPSTEVRAAESGEAVTPLADSRDEGTSTAARVAGGVVVVLLAAAAAIVVRRRVRA